MIFSLSLQLFIFYFLRNGLLDTWSLSVADDQICKWDQINRYIRSAHFATLIPMLHLTIPNLPKHNTTPLLTPSLLLLSPTSTSGCFRLIPPLFSPPPHVVTQPEPIHTLGRWSLWLLSFLFRVCFHRQKHSVIREPWLFTKFFSKEILSLCVTSEILSIMTLWALSSKFKIL